MVLPASLGVTAKVPSFVMRSPLVPVSFFKATLGALGAVASTVTLPLSLLVLPAASVALTLTGVVPSFKAATALSANVHVPLPLLAAV